MYDIKIEKQQYGDLTVLQNMKCKITEGEFIVIMGESGCGKTTFLNIISGILKGYQGEVYFHNIPLHDRSISMLTKIRGEELGMIFQDFQLIDFLNVKENIKLINSNMKEEDLDELLKKLNILEIKDKEISKLSGGQKQRVAIARALAGDRKIILADEPTASLDAKTSREIMEIFKNLHKEGYTIVMITHSPQIASYANKMLYLYDGRFETEVDLKGMDQSKKLKKIIEIVEEHYEEMSVI